MKRLLVLCLVPFLFACATTQTKMTDAQKDALLLLGGNALGVAIQEAIPDSTAMMKGFCARFQKTTDLIEAKTLLETGLAYLGSQYPKYAKLKPAVLNVLQLMGLSQGNIEALLAAQIDKAVKVEGFTAETYRKALLVTQGFCQMVV